MRHHFRSGHDKYSESSEPDTRAHMSDSGNPQRLSAIGARLRAVAVTATVQQGCNPEILRVSSRRQKT